MFFSSNDDFGELGRTPFPSRPGARTRIEATSGAQSAAHSCNGAYRLSEAVISLINSQRSTHRMLTPPIASQIRSAFQLTREQTADTPLPLPARLGGGGKVDPHLPPQGSPPRCRDAHRRRATKAISRPLHCRPCQAFPRGLWRSVGGGRRTRRRPRGLLAHLGGGEACGARSLRASFLSSSRFLVVDGRGVIASLRYSCESHKVE